MNAPILITGGAKRVGAQLARELAAKGHPIALHYNTSEEEAKAVRIYITAKGGVCELFQHDMQDVAGMDALLAQVREKFPTLGGLVNNASVFERAEFLEAQADVALFDRQFDINLKAPVFLTQAFARAVQQGAVVNMLDSNMVGTHGSHFFYLMSKKALADFTAMAARSLGPAIRVNGVAPGHVLPSGEDDEAYEEKLRERLPLAQTASLKSVCDAVAFLLHAPHITGQIIHVDGGQHIL